MITCSVEKTSWLRHLPPLPDPEGSRVYINLDENAKIKYDEVKKALFQHFLVTLAMYRLKLNNLKRKSRETWAISRGKTYLKK